MVTRSRIYSRNQKLLRRAFLLISVFDRFHYYGYTYQYHNGWPSRDVIIIYHEISWLQKEAYFLKMPIEFQAYLKVLEVGLWVEMLFPFDVSLKPKHDFFSTKYKYQNQWKKKLKKLEIQEAYDELQVVGLP